MSEFSNTLMIVLGLNLVLIISQMGISDFGTNKIYASCDSSILSMGGCNQTNYNSAFANDIPTASTQSTGGNGFTDIFNTINKWFKDGFGAKILTFIFPAFRMLSLTGLDNSFVVIIGSAWYILTFFLVVEWWRGIG